jgi:hypothetical protein
MEFENQHIEEIAVSFHSFYVEGFNLFALGEDQLPHLICACPNKGFARALCGLLKTAERAHDLKVVEAEITSHCYLAPKILADGSLAMVASVFDEAVWVNGEQVMYDGANLELGSPEYEEFVRQFLFAPYTREGSGNE